VKNRNFLETNLTDSRNKAVYKFPKTFQKLSNTCSGSCLYFVPEISDKQTLTKTNLQN
jgi:hypothetical protein